MERSQSISIGSNRSHSGIIRPSTPASEYRKPFSKGFFFTGTRILLSKSLECPWSWSSASGLGFPSQEGHAS
ncbi:hypothetical protein NQ317_018012 [Molorchus minor]|uniref:Uncharacterized protein n=1 Tax=Molorchus minor TaxID=1323400 RepID=A0ABQ9JRY2_9CUCU|nr:hypothetical protein NQ317_018012 [Molorchus minor]